MKIGIDIDGTLAEPMSILCKKYGIEIPSTWNYFKTIGMTDQFSKDFCAVWNDHWDIVPLIENDASETMHALVDKGVEFTAVTALYGNDKLKWIDLHDLPCTNMVCVNHGVDKAKYFYDLFVDDSPVNYEAFKKEGKRCALFNRPWNRDIDAEIRIFSIKELVNYI